MAINISVKEFHETDFVLRILDVISKTGANPANIQLELTESIFIENVEDVISKMNTLKSYGLKFALDDFGTGYSSLAYLKRLPLDILKIDRSFVRDILTDANSRAIVQTIISLGMTMNMAIIAEGVEFDEQRVLLASLGCHFYQGYLYGRPLPVEELEQLVLNHPHRV
jgi:EAL domain-containing protein (putative c-di-GMP-specific phosphodiesterase class I)